MAIWQYHITVVPQEEIKSFFNGESFISNEDIENINWCKYRNIKANDFVDLEKLFPQQKSWTSNIILYGSEGSNCIEILLSNDVIEEITIRIDLRNYNQNDIKFICDFFEKHHCLFIDYKGKIIRPSINQIIYEIENYDLYKDFLRKTM